MADTHADAVWYKFCRRFHVVEQSEPLLATDDARVVNHRAIRRGSTSSPVLLRSRLVLPLEVRSARKTLIERRLDS